MPWHSGPQAGFTTGLPWIALNPDYPQVNAEAALADPNSVFHHYRQLIALRQQWPVLRDGRFELLWAEDVQVCGYARRLGEQTLLVVANMGIHPTTAPWPQAVPSDQALCLLSNQAHAHHQWGQTLHLQPFEALMLLCT